MSWIRGSIALLACFSAFIVPVGIMSLGVLGLADFDAIVEVLKTWLAFIGPFAGAVIGFYFRDSENQSPIKLPAANAPSIPGSAEKQAPARERGE